MKMRFKVVSLCVTILFFSMIISQKAIIAEGQRWQSVPQADYAEVLERIAFRAAANYEEISSWQGKMSILETKHHYGSNAAKMSNADPDSIAHDSQYIFEMINSTAEFAVDLRNDKLCSKKEKPQVRLRAMDLDQNVPVRKNGEYESVRTILTREQYVWYMPDSNFASTLHNVRAGKMAFIDEPKERKFSLSGDIRDPRLFFESSGEDGRKLWDSLARIRSNIKDRIKERIAGYPHIEISSLDTDNGIKYRILTTWKGDKNYYIRSLLVVDEAVGFNAIKTEMTNHDGVRINSKEYAYQKLGEIYLPRTVRKEFWNHKGEPTFTSEIIIETTSINKPLLEETFSIKNLGVEEGALIKDNIKKATFRYVKGELVPLEDANQKSGL